MVETQLNYSNHPAKNNSSDIIVHSGGVCGERKYPQLIQSNAVVGTSKTMY